MDAKGAVHGGNGKRFHDVGHGAGSVAVCFVGQNRDLLGMWFSRGGREEVLD